MLKPQIGLGQQVLLTLCRQHLASETQGREEESLSLSSKEEISLLLQKLVQETVSLSLESTLQ